MKWIYILILLVVAASTSGCVDKNKDQVETSRQTPTPAQTSVLPDEAAVSVTPGAVVTPAVSSASDDLFGTESNLSAIDTTFNDMNMEISLLDTDTI